MTTTPGSGHFFPLVPFAWALRARGHQVLTATPEQSVAEVGRSGLPAVAVSPAIDVRAAMAPGGGAHPSQRAGAGDASAEHMGRGFGRLAELTVEGTAALAEGWSPDLVISEPAEYSGAVVAAARGVPLVRHGWGIAVPAAVDEIAADQLAPALARLGLPAPAAPELSIDICPAAVQVPDPRPVRRMRFIPYNGSGSAPGWALESAGRRRICLTVGSVVPQIHGVGLLKGLAAELAGEDTEVVIAVPDRFAGDLGPLPPGVRAAGRLPLSLVLGRCDAVVHHGGIGTALTALTFGLPQVALPFMGDQHVTADRLAAAGVAIGLGRDEREPAAVAAAVRRVLAEPGYARAAQAVGTEIAIAPSLDEVARDVERFSSERGARTPARSGKRVC
ncbi:glycosyltransferase [Actinomadura violacea]|uniref:DUF1205 domain-containing protein n=1 Tax=Actinomadura violacea TaxID=2819934 RepID=A0ABS3S1N2_9ACTN|nr:glycosyltransferase [Actinomadura violacea]MBO2462633.1 DUF1205 domain-containing protein [Actinomadura violacea]